MSEPFRPIGGVSGTRARGLSALISLLALGAVAVWAFRQGKPEPPDSRGDAILVALAVATVIFNTAFRGWRWHRVLRQASLPHSRFDAIAITFVGYMGNTVLPARGGDILRIALARARWPVSVSSVAGSLIAERLLDVLAVVILFVLVTALRIGDAPLGDAPAVVAVALTAAAGVATVIYLRLRKANRFDRFASLARPFTRATRALLGPAGALLLGLTLAIWTLDGLVFYLVGSSLGAELSPAEALFLVTLAGFAGLVPALPGYVGTFDGAVVLGARALDVRGDIAVAFVLLVRFVIFVPITVLGAILLASRYGGFRRTHRTVETFQPR